LRIGRQPALQKSKGDFNWKEVAYELGVAEGLREVELVCELRAAKGDAWFELDSLRLMRK